MPAEKKLLPCPFCGELPEISKHFKEEMYRLIHRCKVIGPIVLDWADKGYHEHRWNRRTLTKAANGSPHNCTLVPCPTCGAACRIHGGGEGTGSYEPVTPYREQLAR
jgi:hypothetical protein